MANTSNLSSLTTNFDVSPYYDDYSPSDQYYRILFKPGYAVQARELTQMQTILQKQVDRFGKHIFKDGSIVLPGQFSLEKECDYVKIKDTDGANNAVMVSDYKNQYIRGTSTNIEAYVIEAEDGIETSGNTKTLFVRYTTASNLDSTLKTFQPGELLTSNIGNIRVINSANVTGKGSRFVINEGVLFAKEHFIRFPTSSVVLDRYGITPSKKVGFYITEEIKTYEDDTNLLDPALESSNYAAPGADRLKLNPQLIAVDYDTADELPDFAELLAVKDGIITEKFNRPQYNILRDELAKRTLDESGDYYVRGLGVVVRENLDINNNGGYNTLGDPNYLSIGVEPGVGYVKGYEVNKLVTDYVLAEKSNTYGNVTSQTGSTSMGNYVYCDEVAGYFDSDKFVTVSLRDQPQNYLSTLSLPISSFSGSVVGTAIIKNIEYSSGTLGSPAGEIAVYLTDIKMNGSNTFSKNVKSMNVGSAFVADIVLENTGQAKLYDTGLDTLLYYTGWGATRKVLDEDNNPQMDYYFNRSTTLELTNGTGSFTPAFGTLEEFPYSAGSTLSTNDKRDITLTLQTTFNVTPTSTITATGRTNDYTMAGSGFSRLNVGDVIQFSGCTSSFLISTITSDTSLTVATNTPLPPVLNGNTVFKAYTAGRIIDLSSKSVNDGTARSVSLSNDKKTMSIDLKEGISGTHRITYQVNVSKAQQTGKILRSGCYIAINCATHPNGVNGPYDLGFADVFRIRSVRQRIDSTFPTDSTDPLSTNAIENFTIDLGQRDSLYDHASIKPRTPLTTATRLLIEFDYFEPNFTSGRGYYTIDSYPINDTYTLNSNTQIRTEQIPIFNSPTSKQAYDLRNFIDFRPVKKASTGVSYIVNPTTAKTTNLNPVTMTTFDYGSGAGLRFPVPSSPMSYDFSYYLPRKDLVVIDKEGVVSIIKGVPSSFPRTPEVPPTTMALASLYVTPYPSIAPNYSQILNRPDLSCLVKKLSFIRYTMRDIGVLKDRIVNLEYYVSLNALQKDAVDMAVTDEFGFNRFKNGIFVDNFTNHMFGDFKNEDYRIIVDPAEKCIRPFYTMNSFYYDFLPNDPDTTSNIRRTGNLITLDYTEVPLIEQPIVTSARNVELSSYRFVGNLYLDPDIDVWVDTNYVSDTQITIGPSGNNLPETQTTWNEWQRNILGYTVDPYPHDGRTNPNGGGGSWTYYDPTKIFGFTTTQNYPRNIISSPNSPRDQRVTMTYEESRTGTQTTYSFEEDSITLGEKVVNTSLSQYIRPQIIDVNAKGLKPFTRMHVFFDGENMDKYCSPLNREQYKQTPEQRAVGANTYFCEAGVLGGPGPNPPPTGGSCYPAFKANEGAPLIVDETGELFFYIRLPADGSKKFRVGQKEVVVTDSITNSVDASTYAKGYFYAQGMIQQKSGTILTTRSIVSNTTTVSETTGEKVVIGYIDNPSCTAYSFLPKAPDGEEGVFLTSVDLWFSAKHPKYGIWCEVRVMDNAGNITRTPVPLSEVWLDSDEINISTNGIDNPTKITFPSPLFLFTNQEYAFVIHTVGLNPDTYVWISRLGETDINTGKKHSARPLTGTFYTTNNNMNWNMVDDIDLRIKFNRAKFVKGSGTVVIGNRPIERFVVNTDIQIGSTLSELGFIAPPTVTQLVAPPITIHYDEVFITRTVNSTINIGWSKGDYCQSENVIKQKPNCKFRIIGSSSVSKSHSIPRDTRFSYHKSKSCSRSISSSSDYDYRIYRANGYATQGFVSAKKSAGKFKKRKTVAKVKKIKTHPWKPICNTKPPHCHESGKDTYLELTITTTETFSNGKTVTIYDPGIPSEYLFQPGVYGTTSTTNAVIEILDVKDYRYTLVDFEPTYLTFKKTEIKFEMKTTLNTATMPYYQTPTLEYKPIISSSNYYFDDEMVLMSRSNEILKLGGECSNKVRVNMSTTTDFLSPVLDMARCHSVYVDNLINANTIATANVYQSYPLECIERGGELVNKYISIPVTLAEGQDAEDMLVMLTAYRPPTTDVTVWVKILNGEDNDTLANKKWIPLQKLSDSSYSSIVNRSDFKEFTFKFPDSMKTGAPTDNSPGGEIQYKNGDITFTGYKYFQIKIGLSGVNSAVIPRVADLRVIALQI